MRRRSRLALIAALALLQTPVNAVSLPWVEHVGTHVWRGEGPDFGGFSGFELDADGLGFVAVTDTAALWRGRLTRDALGRVTGAEAGPPLRLRDSTGKPLTRFYLDAEGLAVAEDGAIYISFENLHRVARYDDPAGAAVNIPRPREFADLQRNSGIEALAIDAGGALYAIPERSGSLTRPFPVFRFRDGEWEIPFSIPRDGDWLPVGADFGPDGRLYLVERDFWGILGFLTRVRRFEVGETEITGGEVLFATTAGTHDNLESIAVWRDAGGAIRLTLLSDDNFRFFQRTEFVDYRVTE